VNSKKNAAMTTSWQISVWNVYSVQGYHSPDRKSSQRFFPDEIAGSMSNKCTFINPNSL